MSNKQNLLKQLDDGYAFLKQTFTGLSDRQITQLASVTGAHAIFLRISLIGILS